MMLENEADSSSLCKIYNLQSVSISSEISSFASFHYRLECFQLPRVVDRVEETLKRDIPRTQCIKFGKRKNFGTLASNPF